MNIKAGFRALTLGLAMVWGAASAEAVTVATGTGPGSFDLIYDFENVTGRTDILITGRVSAAGPFGSDAFLTVNYDAGPGFRDSFIVGGRERGRIVGLTGVTGDILRISGQAVGVFGGSVAFFQVDAEARGPRLSLSPAPLQALAFRLYWPSAASCGRAAVRLLLLPDA